MDYLYNKLLFKKLNTYFKNIQYQKGNLYFYMYLGESPVLNRSGVWQGVYVLKLWTILRPLIYVKFFKKSYFESVYFIDIYVHLKYTDLVVYFINYIRIILRILFSEDFLKKKNYIRHKITDMELIVKNFDLRPEFYKWKCELRLVFIYKNCLNSIIGGDFFLCSWLKLQI